MSEQTINQVHDDTTSEYTDLTPYMAAKVATKVLQAAGKLTAEQEVKPQSMYSNKTIKRTGTKKSDGGSGVFFVGSSFKQWLDLQLTSMGTASRGRVNVDALANEYMADFEEVEAIETSVTDDKNEDELEAAIAGSEDAKTEDDAE